MKCIRLFCAGIVLIITILSCKRPVEPLDLARNIFGSDSFPDREKYIVHPNLNRVIERHGWPYGMNLYKYVTQKFLLLEQTDKRAIVVMTIIDSTGKGFDACIYFQKDTIWKMSSYHTYMPDYTVKLKNKLLKEMTPFQVDSVIEKSKTHKTEWSNLCVSSTEDFNFQLGATSLLLSIDDTLINHLVKHKADFEHIKSLALAEMDNGIDGRCEIKLLPSSKKKCYKLYISGISKDEKNYGNCLIFVIDGRPIESRCLFASTSDIVGYLYVEDKKQLPEMNADNIYMLREIGDGWYLYRKRIKIHFYGY
jgi:hypothetical protein